MTNEEKVSMNVGELYQKIANHEPITVDDFADAIETFLDELNETIAQVEQYEQDTRRRRKNMGAFDNNERTITIPESAEQGKKWGWDPHESVTCRVVVTMADEEFVNNEVIKAAAPRGKKNKNKNLDVQSQLGATRKLWLIRMIKSWTFTRGGTPVAVSPEAIRALPSHYADRIYDAIMAEQPEDDVDEEDEEDEDSFFKPASAPIEEEALTHETAPKNHLAPLK